MKKKTGSTDNIFVSYNKVCELADVLYEVGAYYFHGSFCTGNQHSLSINEFKRLIYEVIEDKSVIHTVHKNAEIIDLVCSEDDEEHDILYSNDHIEYVDSIIENGIDVLSFTDYIFDCLEKHNEKAKRLSHRYHSYKARRIKANLHIAKPEVRERIFSRDGFKCVKCGSISRLSIDHIIPVILDGSNEDDNLRVLCMKCNTSKGGNRE